MADFGPYLDALKKTRAKKELERRGFDTSDNSGDELYGRTDEEGNFIRWKPSQPDGSQEAMQPMMRKSTIVENKSTGKTMFGPKDMSDVEASKKRRLRQSDYNPTNRVAP